MSPLAYSSFIKYFAFSGLIFHHSNQIALRGENVRNAEEREFPSVVSIGKKTNNHQNIHLCTGTLITRQHVLTAEHCLEDWNPADIEVTVGSINRRLGTKYQANHWVTYDEWKHPSGYRNESALHDIAIIKVIHNCCKKFGDMATPHDFASHSYRIKIATLGPENYLQNSILITCGPLVLNDTIRISLLDNQFHRYIETLQKQLLCWLQTDEHLNSTVRNAETAKLSKRPSAELYGSDIKMAGWGITNNNKKPVILKTALSKVMSTEECIDYIDELTDNALNIRKNCLCSRTEPWLLTGSGDSGGPSFDKNNKLVGVTVGRCPHEDFLINQPEVLEQTQIVLHMDIKYYKSFIHSVTKSKLRVATRVAKKLFTKPISYCGFRNMYQ